MMPNERIRNMAGYGVLTVVNINLRNESNTGFFATVLAVVCFVLFGYNWFMAHKEEEKSGEGAV